MGQRDEWRPGPRDAITDVPGIRVGHWTDRRGATGCTVILCETAVAAAADTRGGAPGTRETDVLALSNLVRTCHAVLLTGGSAFGLAAADGVMRFLEEHDVGFATQHRRVPIVPAAVLYDCGVGRATAYPGAEAGYRAAASARRGRVAEGSVGAGTGATVAKLMGLERASKGGVGSASAGWERGIVVGALVATNAAGNIYQPETGRLLAGPRDDDGRYIELGEALSRRSIRMEELMQNTTLACIATNLLLEPEHLQRIAVQVHDALARAVRPAHTFADGDVAFAISMGPLEARPEDIATAGVLAERAVERALVRSVLRASPVAGIPSVNAWPLPNRPPGS